MDKGIEAKISMVPGEALGSLVFSEFIEQDRER